ncbi:tetratricopeptide repeat protein [Yinghuangia soli]|uniref:Tetratricopeptide repeat protein n=1 Tax=Yinghuangia soli TaxID=2908204 RepID=A0AA41Q9Z0_9ACTN|nr:tetratricopeptide repeat protein [Yinghuangia soli]MCF2533951.1 tetratricopeptide repeat protein [Yinghuangia soli]
MRWAVASTALIALFFAIWGLCRAGDAALDLDVTLALAGLGTSIASPGLVMWASRPALPAPPPLTAAQRIVLGEIPREPPGYQARTVMREQLERLDGVAVVGAVTGARGAGKTQLAAAVARRRIADGWPLVAWIVAEDADQAVAGMQRLARAVGAATDREDAATAAAAARAWLETQADERTLLVFDNVPAPEIVRPWLPSTGAAHIIVTSTDRSCEHLGTPVRVDVFTPAEATDFLRARAGNADPTAARELAEELGHLPLALAQAAAVIRSSGLSYATVLARIRETPVERLLLPHGSDPYPRGAAQATLASIENVEATDPTAGLIATLLALLSPGGVPRDLVHGLVDGPLGRHLPHAPSVVEVDAALGRLADASLLTFTVDGQFLLMHRFTQRVLRDRAARTGDLPGYVDHAARLLQARCTAMRGDSLLGGQSWTARHTVGEHLIAQVETLWEVSRPHLQETAPDPDWTAAQDPLLALRVWAVHHLWTVVDTSRAVRAGRIVVEDHERLLGSDCEATTEARYALALAYGGQLRHDQAIALNTAVVDWFADHHGGDDPQTLLRRSILGNNYLESGEDFADPSRYLTSIRLHELALQGWDRAGDPDYLLRPWTEFNLALAYARAGRFTEAIQLADQVSARCDAELGEAETVTTSSRLARTLVYALAGRLDIAGPESIHDVEQARRVWGDDDPGTLWAHMRRGEILCLAADFDGATRELEVLAARHVSILGENNPSTFRTVRALAEAYRQAGRLPEALRASERMLLIGRHLVDPNSPLIRLADDRVRDLRAHTTAAPTPP